MKRLLLLVLLLTGCAAQPREGKFSGVVEATAYDQGFETPGTLAEIPVKEGQSVSKGALLARLDDRAQKAALEQARARLGEAQARLDQARNGPRQTEIEQARARADMARAELEQAANGVTQPELDAARDAAEAARQRYALLQAGSREEDILSAESQVAANQESLRVAKADLARYTRLYREGAVPLQQLENVRNRTESAESAYEVARQTYRKQLQGPRVQERRSALFDYRSAQARYQTLAQGTRPEQIARARAAVAERKQLVRQLEEGTRPEEVRAAARQVEQAKAQVQTAEVNLAKTKLYATAAGVVTARNLEPGEAVAPGVPVVSLVDLDHPWVYIYIPEPELAQVKLGAKAQVTADSLSKPLPGEVVRVYEKAEFTPKFIQTERERVNLVFRAKVGVQNPDHALRPGMPADVQL